MKIAVAVFATLASIATTLTFVFDVFASAPNALSASVYRERIDGICKLASNEQANAERSLRNFGRAFPKATTVTEARDLIVGQVQQQISAAADLSSPLEALAPPAEYAPQQARIIKLLRTNLERLRNYESELNLLTSPLQLVALVQTVPRAEMNADAVSGRAILLGLGGDGCELPRWPVVRVVDWSPQLRLRIRRTAEKTARTLDPHAPPGAAGEDGALPNPVPVAVASRPDHRRFVTQSPETERRELRLATSVPAPTDAAAERAETAEERLVTVGG